MGLLTIWHNNFFWIHRFNAGIGIDLADRVFSDSARCDGFVGIGESYGIAINCSLGNGRRNFLAVLINKKGNAGKVGRKVPVPGELDAGWQVFVLNCICTLVWNSEEPGVVEFYTAV